VLKQKGVDADADQTDRQSRSEIKTQMLSLKRSGQSLPQRLARLDRSSEWSRACPDARKSQSQFFLLRLRFCRVLQIAAPTWSISIGSADILTVGGNGHAGT